METELRNRYGHFAADGSEYVIRTPDTPRPWINYLTNGDYCALISACGGGFSFYKDHRFHSVLRRGQHIHLEDAPGRLWYIKDEETLTVCKPASASSGSTGSPWPARCCLCPRPQRTGLRS